MKLDFTFQGKIDPKYARMFNQIAVNLHKPFTDLIDSISRQHAKSLDWWVSSPASRNTFVSPLFHYCCCIALLQELIGEKEPVSEIITDSRAFKKILREYLAGQGVNARVTLAGLPVKQRLKELIRPIYTIFGLPMKHLILFFAAKLTRSLRKPLPSEPLTLIDTFIYTSTTEDRHYSGIMNVLTEGERKTIYFVPFFHKPNNMIILFRKLRTDKNNFLLKEDFLKISDYLVGWKHFGHIRRKKISPCFFSGIGISSLVREELQCFKSFSSAYASLLNYSFVKRLKQAGVGIRLVIDWFEGQVIDKGWNAGFNKFYPNTPSIGYQGFITTTHYLCMYPTTIEKRSNVIPKEVAVIGKGLISSAKKFCPDLNVSVAPAFRFQGVWKGRKYFPEEHIFTIMVALPVMLDVGDEILKLLERSLEKKVFVGVRFWVKQHPDNTPETIKKQFGNSWPEQFEFVEGNFNDCVERSNLLISTGSSSCMHALAKGMPVIIIGSQSGLTHNPIPPAIEEDLWRLCYDANGLSNAIDFYMNQNEQMLSRHEMIGEEIRKEYFEPVTREAVRSFLKFTD